MKRIAFASLVMVAAMGLCVLAAGSIKAGFIYVGPIGDYGWTFAHDEARRIVDEEFDWLETVCGIGARGRGGHVHRSAGGPGMQRHLHH